MNIRDEQRLVDAVVALAKTNVEVKGLYEKFHAETVDRLNQQYQEMLAMTRRLVEVREQELNALANRRQMDIIKAKYDIVAWQTYIEYLEAHIESSYDKATYHKDIAACKTAIQCVREQYPELATVVGSD